MPDKSEVMKSMALHIWNTYWPDPPMITPEFTYYSSETGLDKGLKLAIPVSVLIWVVLLMMIL